MKNADKFKVIFGLYATELWAKSEKGFLTWLNEEVPETTVGDTISRQAAIDAFEKELSAKYNRRELAIGFVGVESILRDLPSAQPERPKGHWIDIGSGQECSECGEVQYGYDNFRYYCAKCGAEMVKGEEDGRSDKQTGGD